MESDDDIGAAIRAAAHAVHAPPSLRQQVEGQRSAARRRGRRVRALLAGAAAVAAATGVALALVLPSGGGPSVADAAALALAPPTAPGPAPADATTLDARVGELSFPAWDGWRAVGERAQRLDGRVARAVVYEDGDGRRVGYAIVAGAPLDAPDGRRLGGVTILRRAGATLATWRRDGHTCVLASTDAPAEELAALAGGGY